MRLYKTFYIFTQGSLKNSENYYPFGMEMAGRGFSGSYRFGYQGSEKDNEVSGDGNSYTTEFRQLDPRLGRWFSVDPVFQPWQSPYTSMDNNPINLNDPLGLDPKKGKHHVVERDGKPNWLQRMATNVKNWFSEHKGRKFGSTRIVKRKGGDDHVDLWKKTSRIITKIRDFFDGPGHQAQTVRAGRYKTSDWISEEGHSNKYHSSDLYNIQKQQGYRRLVKLEIMADRTELDNLAYISVSGLSRGIFGSPKFRSLWANTGTLGILFNESGDESGTQSTTAFFGHAGIIPFAQVFISAAFSSPIAKGFGKMLDMELAYVKLMGIAGYLLTNWVNPIHGYTSQIKVNVLQTKPKDGVDYTVRYKVRFWSMYNTSDNARPWWFKYIYGVQ